MNHHEIDQLNSFFKKIESRAKNYIGYPAGRTFDYSELYPFLNCSLNNIGDPFVESGDMHSKVFEREVLSFFAEIFKAPVDNWWGYVTNGGSEGNLYALYLARELYPEGMVYYSEATHYSVQKNIHLLGMPSIVIRTQPNGEMDYEDLKDTIGMHRHKPAIILANVGTTMTEAKDDVARIKMILNCYAIKSSYIHSDAALSGIYLGLLNEGNFNFEQGADSIAISGHKFIGSPITCGIVLVRKNYKDRIGRSIPYIGSLDTTITGSRNGITPLFLWYAIKKLGKQGLYQRAAECLELAGYIETELNNIGIKAWRNPHTLTVVFPKPPLKIGNKWQLASEGAISHLICMPGVSKEQLDEFIIDMKNAHQHSLNCDITASNYNLN
jgi:histidine decarboxylase